MAQTHITENLDRRLNVFPLSLPPNTLLRYRLWAVEPVPVTPKLREKIRSFLWRKTLRRPVFPHYNNGFCFAVADWGSQDTVEYIGDGEKRYTISATGEYRNINVTQIRPEEAEFAAAMVQQEMDLYIGKNVNLTKGYSHNQYFLAQPDIPYNFQRKQPGQPAFDLNQDQVDILRGFTFRVAYFKDFGLCLVIDALTSYVGRVTLAEYLKQGNNNPKLLQIAARLSRWVNDYGNQKQSVYLRDLTDRSIDKVILKDDRTVFEYLRDSHPQIREHITPEDRAVSIIYRLDDLRDEEKHYTASASLLKPKFTNLSPEVRILNDIPAFPPDERLDRVREFRRLFFGVRFASKSITINNEVKVKRSVFEMPSLLFGDGQVLTLSNDDLQNRADWGERKLEYLRKHGPLEQKKFTNPFLVYPVSLEEDDLLDRFLNQTKILCKQLGCCEFEPELSSYDDRAHSFKIISKIKGIVDSQRAGFILLALPKDPKTATQVYTGLKTQVKVPSKCFSSHKLRQRPQKDFLTYTTLNTLGMLVENGTQLWGLAKPLNYEVHFGFDVARTQDASLMGASVITDPSASKVHFDFKPLSKRDGFTKREGIPTKIIRTFILDQLEKFYATNGRLPRNILFHRDGRLFEDELKGVDQAVKKAIQQYSGTETPKWTAVAIQKNSSMKLRMMDRNAGSNLRPVSGSYIIQTNNIGHLITAGAPTLRHGTPKPMQIELLGEIPNNNAEIIRIMEDEFSLSQLNWNAPAIDINLPVILRFTDEKLERYALELDEEDDDDEWEDQDDEFEDE